MPDPLIASLVALIPPDWNAVNTVLATLLGGISALIYGVWDRRRRAAREDRQTERERQEHLARMQQSVVDALRQDRDYQQHAKDATRRELDAFRRAADVYVQQAHELRHNAANHIQTLAGTEAGRYPLPPLPSLARLEQEERQKTRRVPKGEPTPSP